MQSNDLMAQLRAKQQAEEAAARDEEEGYRGQVSQLIQEYNDILETADPEDPIFQQRAPTLMRKRDQLQGLLDNKRYSGPRIGGILKRGLESSMLEPTTQGEVGEMISQKRENQKEEARKASLGQNAKAPQNEQTEKTDENDNFHSSSTTISLD